MNVGFQLVQHLLQSAIRVSQGVTHERQPAENTLGSIIRLHHALGRIPLRPRRFQLRLQLVLFEHPEATDFRVLPPVLLEVALKSLQLVVRIRQCGNDCLGEHQVDR